MPFEFARYIKVDVLDAATHEHAPTLFRFWLGQRTRWMKGWMQTFIVHNRDPGTLLADMGLPAFLAFQTLILGMIVAPLLHCVFLTSVLARLVFGGDIVHEAIWTVFYLALLLLGYGGAIATNALGLHRLKAHHLLSGVVLLPVYWLLQGLATIRAAQELVSRPFYWFKSPHRPAVSASMGAGGLRWLRRHVT